ncbi:MAG: DNA repair protein RadA, partial [Desulfobaccales bacterium]
MSRAGRPVFVCQQCGYQAAKWLGRCPECGAWSSMAEEEIAPVAPGLAQLPPRRGQPLPLLSL